MKKETARSLDLPADPFLPVGYERRDTVASLSMLAGSIVIGFATATAFAKFDRFLFKHRVSKIGSRRGAIIGAMVLWDFLYYWEHRWMHESRLLWSHHVTHGANRQYLDKNYGGILVVWDKLFGTFEPELRRVKYGLTKNINTYNPLRIAYHEMADIARDVRSARGWRHKLGYVFRHPGWKPALSAPHRQQP